MPAPKVFISYSHDSIQHRDRVRHLADRLRSDGIDAGVDQYVPAPPQGWPIWMEKQIRESDYVLIVCTNTYLKRVERREIPGRGRGVLWEVTSIYNAFYREDSEIQKFIPVLFAGSEASCIPLALQGLTYYRLDLPEGYEDLYRHLTNQPRHQIPVLGKRKSLPPIASDNYPAWFSFQSAAQISSSLVQRHRQRLLRQVHRDWIQGVLEQPLYKEAARIGLELTDRPDLVEFPRNTSLRVPDRPPRIIPSGTPISEIFDDSANGSLLILGAPGTGKTTLLLELTRDLLLRAGQESDHPMPVVFNLSSWTLSRAPLRDWLIKELNEKNHVPKKEATMLVENEQVLLLLDGLDEVAAEYRADCVEAINRFRREYGQILIAICSRISDYQELRTKLRLDYAIEIQPLSRTQVKDYLELAGEPLAGLRMAVEKDPSLRELLETPLMLEVAMVAYRNVSPDFMQNIPLAEGRRQLFAQFVDKMVQRGDTKRFSAAQTRHWLCSLASTMTSMGQTVLYLEELDFPWLRTKARQWLARTAVTVIGGLLGALVFGVGSSLFALVARQSAFVEYLRHLPMLNTGLTVGSVEGLACMLFVLVSITFLKLEPAEEIRFALPQISSQEIKVVGASLSFGLVFGLIIGLQPVNFYIMVYVCLIFGTMFGLFVMLLVGLNPLQFHTTDPSENQTTGLLSQRSIRSTAWACMVGAISGVVAGIPIETNFTLGLPWVSALNWIALFGSVGAVSCALFGIQPLEGLLQRNEALRIGLSAGVLFGLFAAVLSRLVGTGRDANLVMGISFAVVFGLIAGIIRAFVREADRETRSTVNLGTRRSLKMSLLFSLILATVGGAAGWLLWIVLLGQKNQGVGPLFVAIFCGLSFGIIGGFTSGGVFVIKHSVLRLFISVDGTAPLKYPSFLAFAKELLFLKQVGGGYIFFHRLLQEYFVSLSELQSKPTPDQVTGKQQKISAGP